MILHINRLELDFTESMYLQSEALIDKEINRLKLVDKNLWSYTSSTTPVFEVELLKTGREKFKVTCDCKEFEENKKCHHILAALVLWKTESIRPKVAVKKRNNPKSFTLKSILQSVNADELAAFVQSYAKLNPKFAIAIKSNFARKLELEDNSVKYKYILDSIIRPKSANLQKVSAGNKKLFFDTVSDFYEQFGDCFALKNYQESYCILKNIHLKSEYLGFHFIKNDARLSELIKKNHKSYQTLFDSDLAPELLTIIVNDLIEFTEYTYVTFDDPEENIFNVLLNNSLLTAEQSSSINANLLKRLASVEEDHEWSLIQGLIFRLNQTIEPKNQFENVSLNRLLKSAKYLIDQNEVDLCGELINAMKDQFGDTLGILLIKLELAKKEKDQVQIRLLGMDIFQITKRSKSISSLKDHLNKSNYQWMITQLENRFLDIKSQNYGICELLCLEGKTILLSSKLKECDFDDFLQLAPLLTRCDDEFVFQVYWESLDRYVQNHLGEEANQSIKHLFSNLITPDQGKIAFKLKKKLASKYSDRQKLIFI